MKINIISNVYERIKDNENIIVLTGDLGYKLFDKIAYEYPNNFYNCGISEQNMVLVAAGLALSGKIPIIYSIGNFISLRVLEQIRNSICYHNLNVKIISNGVGFSYGQLGFTHHLTEDIGAVRSLPNIDIYSPANIKEANYYFDSMLSNKKPSYFRLDKTNASNIYDINDYSGVNYVQKGDSILISSTGGILEEVLEANKILLTKNINIGIISFVKIKPDNTQEIKKILKNYQTLVTVEEGNLSAGFGSYILELINDLKIELKVHRMGLENLYTSTIGDQKYLRHKYGLSGKSISDLVIALQEGEEDE